MVRFDAKLQKLGSAAIFKLPKGASEKLSSRGQVAVKGTVNARRFEAVLEPDGRKGHWLKADSKLRKIAGVAEGGTATFEVEPADTWPEPKLPTDFADALAKAPDLHAMWQDITPMARWEWVRWINATKNPQTRQRRVEVTLSKMRSGKRRPCCFDLSSCTDPELAKSGKLMEG
jgi:hypothetical protein